MSLCRKAKDPKGGNTRNSGWTHRHSTARRPLRWMRRSLPAFPPSRQAFPQERLPPRIGQAEKAWIKADKENANSEWKERLVEAPPRILSTFAMAFRCARRDPFPPRHPRAEQERKRTAETRGSMPERSGRPGGVEPSVRSALSPCCRAFSGMDPRVSASLRSAPP
jgi:hypothetical protein